MKALHWLFHFYQRARYPASFPKDIALDLGLVASAFLSFDELFKQLTDSSCCPKNLKKYMSREEAEAAFNSAQRHERFGRNTLFSYYFSEGWLEFSLHFDEHGRLRRVYLQHKMIEENNGIEIPLSRDPLNLFQ